MGAGYSSGRRPPEDPHCFPRDPSINSQSPPPAGPGGGFLSGNPGQPAMPRTPAGMGQGAEVRLRGSSPVSWAPLQGPTPRARARQLPPGPGPGPSHRGGRAAQLWALSLAARPGQRAKAPRAYAGEGLDTGLERTQLLSAESRGHGCLFRAAGLADPGRSPRDRLRPLQKPPGSSLPGGTGSGGPEPQLARDTARGSPNPTRGPARPTLTPAKPAVSRRGSGEVTEEGASPPSTRLPGVRGVGAARPGSELELPE